MIGLHSSHETSYDNDGKPIAHHDAKGHRFTVMDRLAGILSKYRGKYGSSVVLACDSSSYWRREEFTHYKANRKAIRDYHDTIDWKAVFAFKDVFLEELRTYSKFHIITVDQAEGDDVIAALVETFAPSEPVLIVSRDKDFTQLMEYSKVAIHDPDKNRLLARPTNVQMELLEHVLKGDKVDGIPNVLSDGAVFVTDGARQAVMTEARYNYLVNVPVNDWNNEDVIRDKLAPAKAKQEAVDKLVDMMETAQVNMVRNQKLIDLRLIPADLKAQIIDKYYEPINRGPRGMFDYFYKYGLTRLMDKVSHF